MYIYTHTLGLLGVQEMGTKMETNWLIGDCLGTAIRMVLMMLRMLAVNGSHVWPLNP